MQQFSDLRDAYIARVVSGKTFGEVGGLWGTVSEKVSVAHAHGATSLTMIDVSPMDNELWLRFRARLVELRVPEVREISADICSITNEEISGPFDVVHCSGVLYHHPNPMVMLLALRNITRQYLVLTSAVTQTVIENEHGRYEIPPSGVMFVPALSVQEFEIVRAYWQAIHVSGQGLTERCRYTIDNFDPWWWLPTPTSMMAMCEAAGFKVEDDGPNWEGNSHTVLLSVRQRS